MNNSTVRKLFLFTLLLVMVLNGCSSADKKENSAALSYNYPPPLEGISWGMSENEVIKAFGMNEKKIEWQESDSIDYFGNGKAGTDRFFVVEDPVTFLDEEVTATVAFSDDIGLSYVFLQLNDTSDANMAKVQLKLQERYGSSWGTVVQDIDKEQKDKLREFLLEHGMSEEAVDLLLRDISEERKEDKAREVPLVSYSIETNAESPAYGSINFKGYLAAMLERSAGR